MRNGKKRTKTSKIQNDVIKPKGLLGALRELYGQDLKFRPEDIVEAAWKEVPKYRK